MRVARMLSAAGAVPLALAPMTLALATTGLVAAQGEVETRPASVVPRVRAIVDRMRAAYEAVDGYRTETVIRLYRDGAPSETQRFLYTFRKPHHLRMDFEKPHRGATLVYPDEKGCAVVKPGGLLGFLRLRYGLDSERLRSPSGQRLDQTDFGTLIENIRRSLTQELRGEISLLSREGRTHIDVLAEDHFLPDVVTRYRFVVDETSWLPAEVLERSPEGALRRHVTFSGVETNVTLPDGTFDLGANGGGKDHGQRDG